MYLTNVLLKSELKIVPEFQLPARHNLDLVVTVPHKPVSTVIAIENKYVPLNYVQWTAYPEAFAGKTTAPKATSELSDWTVDQTLAALQFLQSFNNLLDLRCILTEKQSGFKTLRDFHKDIFGNKATEDDYNLKKLYTRASEARAQFAISIIALPNRCSVAADFVPSKLK